MRTAAFMRPDIAFGVSAIEENGVVFSDGIESDYVSFNSGTVLTVGVAAECGQLIVH